MGVQDVETVPGYHARPQVRRRPRERGEAAPIVGPVLAPRIAVKASLAGIECGCIQDQQRMPRDLRRQQSRGRAEQVAPAVDDRRPLRDGGKCRVAWYERGDRNPMRCERGGERPDDIREAARFDEGVCFGRHGEDGEGQTPSPGGLGEEGASLTTAPPSRW